MSETKRRAGAIVGPRINQVMRALALEGMGRMMEKTPVKTGRARANWNISANQVDDTVDEGLASADVESKRAAGMAEIARTDFAEGDRLFVTNGLSYIEALEGGSSTQAPNGMVAVTVEELKPIALQLGAKVGGG